MYYSHILNLNMNKWVSVKGRFEEVPSNSVSMSNRYSVVSQKGTVSQRLEHHL